MTRAADQTTTAEVGPPRGPEGAFLADRVKLALRGSGYSLLRHVEVTVQAGAVVLRGEVPSYHLKQVAQAAALAVLATHRVRNDLAVVRPS